MLVQRQFWVNLLFVLAQIVFFFKKLFYKERIALGFGAFVLLFHFLKFYF